MPQSCRIRAALGGIEAACSAGLIAGNADKELEVIADMPPLSVKQIRRITMAIVLAMIRIPSGRLRNSPISKCETLPMQC